MSPPQYEDVVADCDAALNLDATYVKVRCRPASKHASRAVLTVNRLSGPKQAGKRVGSTREG